MRDIKYFGLNELRTKFLDFFKSKDHLIIDSFPLVPGDDKSLLLISAGMAPMKQYFTGEKAPPAKRVANCQKCIRVNDIEEVGKTSRHCTFFEMLGNFSFGDYFKKEAVEMTWEFLTKVLEIPEELLFPSVYFEDEEAFEVWTKHIGLPPEKITKLGKKDNFWDLGKGPCGPCSEIYFDRGEKNGCGSPDCAPGCDCDRFIEVCNNVFTQFDNDGSGNYTPLKQKNIDMGMGLERLAMVMQQAETVADVDTVKTVILKTCETAGIEYAPHENSGISARIIGDHIRSAAFMICDGVMPSNEGRGYVLRRLLRRAARHGKLMGIKGAFLHELIDAVIDLSKQAYPELEAKREYIKKVLKAEEDRFEATIHTGLEMLGDMIKKLKENNLSELSGENIFKLYDTYGFPYDLISEIAKEHNLALGREKFDELMQKQIRRAREARANIEGWIKDKLANLMRHISKTEFDGYSVLEERAGILEIIVEDGENLAAADFVNEGEFTLILDKTPFYAESGGQVGDVGTIEGGGGARALVLDCKKTSDGKIIHICKMETGEFKTGAEITAAVDKATREAAARNHSAAHLLQAALREVLGGHIEQAGSYVDSGKLRFDFTHFNAMTPAEIEKTENIVNENILAGVDITFFETDMETAKKTGATALFGEKYGDRVRVVQMGKISSELCGGTHIDNTAKAGLFKIISESSVAAGVRRIEAVTGRGVLDMIKRDKELILNTAGILKENNPGEIAKRAEGAMLELKEQKREIEKLVSEIALGKTKELLPKQKKTGAGVDYLAAVLENTAADEAKIICETLKQKNPDIAAVLASLKENKLTFSAVCGSEAIRRGANAGALVRQVAEMTGGSGGGRPEFAVAGGKELSKLSEALEKGEEFLLAMIKK